MSHNILPDFTIVHRRPLEPAEYLLLEQAYYQGKYAAETLKEDDRNFKEILDDRAEALRGYGGQIVLPFTIFAGEALGIYKNAFSCFKSDRWSSIGAYEMADFRKGWAFGSTAAEYLPSDDPFSVFNITSEGIINASASQQLYSDRNAALLGNVAGIHAINLARTPAEEALEI